MNAIAHNEFAPPPTGGFGKSLSFALFIHLLLLAALTWGIHWKTETQTLSASAELWSAVPAEAAPAANEPEPTPPEPEKEKEKETETAKEAEKKKKDEAQKKTDAAVKAKEDAKKAAAEEKRAAALRNENLKRMQGMAGASGDENAKGTALKSSGPSANYAGRIRARIKPNITFTEDVAGNPKAEVEVRTSPDGTILSRKLLSSSGNKSWDDAVLKAIDKTATLPRDEDGRVPPVLEISFRPKD